MTQAIHSKASFSKVFLEMQITKTSEVASVWSSKSGFKNTDISLPTNHHPFQVRYLSQVLTLSQYLQFPHTTQSSPNSAHLISYQGHNFDKSNFICPMGSSPNLYRTCTFLLSWTSWPSIPCSTHSSFALQTFVPQTVDILNHVPRFLHKDYCMYQTMCRNLTNQL